MSGAAPNLSGFELVIERLPAGFMPRRRPCACQRPLSILIVAIMTSNFHCRSCVGRPEEGAKDKIWELAC